MLRAIHLNNELGFTHEEVSNVALTKHDLTPKRDAELTTLKRDPQSRFRRGWSPPQPVRAGTEELLTFAALLS